MRDSRLLLVVNLPANVRRHFLPWGEPLLPQAVAWLVEGWDENGPLDLSRTLVVVPTHQAGRRLREALAVRAACAHRAVFPPRVMTPDALLTAAGTKLPPAGRLTALLAWSAVLRRLDLEGVRAVFPVDPPERNVGWSVRLARQLCALQATLAESGWRLADVSRIIASQSGGALAELERWHQLGQLESEYDRELAGAGWWDPQAAKIAAATDPVVPRGLVRVVVMATPDPWPIALVALAALARTLPIDVVVYAPAWADSDFDEWGRPRPEVWGGRTLDLPDFRERVHLRADPEAQSQTVAAWAAGYVGRPGVFAVGTADPTLTPVISAALARAQIPVFDPGGRTRRGDRLYQLLAALAEVAAEPSFDNLATLARCPDFLAYVAGRGGAGFSIARWLCGLDSLQARHLPADLAAAQVHARDDSFPAEVAQGLAAMDDLRAGLRSDGFVKAGSAVLSELFAHRRLNLNVPADQAFESSAADWMKVVRECDQEAGAGLAIEDWWDLALGLFGELRGVEEKPAGALELQGWLELLWEDAPHLAVAGCNDGRVPEAVEADPFLPQVLCAKLGVKTNEGRLARDAYLLKALASGRGPGGRLDVLYGRAAGNGDPLRPSRLLLMCPDSELPARVQWLFRAEEASSGYFAWTRAWRLMPPGIGAPAVAEIGLTRRVPVPESAAVTSLRTWLECPFRFYLRYVLHMEEVDPQKCEMNEADFGTLCHGALEAMGHETALRDCVEPRVLRDFLLANLEREARERFGATLTLPLTVQLESARQRLRRAAEVEVKERMLGWRTEVVEHKISLSLSGLVVKARIDRIDRNLETGEIRVLDYKTSDRPKSPEEAHLRRVRASENGAALEIAQGPDRRRWQDLQLPLYRHALAAAFSGPMVCGYFNLPKAAGEVALSLWEPYPPELQDSALACAERVCHAIRGGVFWPPNEEVPENQDTFRALYQGKFADSVHWEGAP